MLWCIRIVSCKIICQRQRVWLDMPGISPTVPIKLQSPYCICKLHHHTHSNFIIIHTHDEAWPLFETNEWAQSTPFLAKTPLSDKNNLNTIPPTMNMFELPPKMSHIDHIPLVISVDTFVVVASMVLAVVMSGKIKVCVDRNSHDGQSSYFS